jgi:glutamate dehydrogenase/leucine dehydrogenase
MVESFGTCPGLVGISVLVDGRVGVGIGGIRVAPTVKEYRVAVLWIEVAFAVCLLPRRV